MSLEPGAKPPTERPGFVSKSLLSFALEFCKLSVGADACADLRQSSEQRLAKCVRLQLPCLADTSNATVGLKQNALAVGVVGGAEAHVRWLDVRLRVLGRVEHGEVIALEAKDRQLHHRSIGGTAWASVRECPSTRGAIEPTIRSMVAVDYERAERAYLDAIASGATS